MDQQNIGLRNVTWGWATMFLGALSGTILMAWSFNGPFPEPPGFENYVDLSRRMTRLAHIALFMVPLINIAIGREIDRLRISSVWKEIASWSAIVGMIGIPLGLLLGALVHYQLKYVAMMPSYALLLSLMIMAVGAVRARNHS